MKHWYILLLFLMPLIGPGQNARIDSLRRKLTHTRKDTSRVELLAELANAYSIYQTDSGVFFAQKALSLSRVIAISRENVKRYTRWEMLSQLTPNL